MVRPIPLPHVANLNNFSSPVPLALGLFVSVSLLVALCAKHGRRHLAEKAASDKPEPNTAVCGSSMAVFASPKAVFGSPTAVFGSPKRLFAAISHKAMIPLQHAKRTWREAENRNRGGKLEGDENGVWRKAIMMGEKCQPLEFSGVIFYDYDGNRVSEMPKSPKASPMRNFNFPAHKSVF